MNLLRRNSIQRQSHRCVPGATADFQVEEERVLDRTIGLSRVASPSPLGDQGPWSPPPRGPGLFHCPFRSRFVRALMPVASLMRFGDTIGGGVPRAALNRRVSRPAPGVSYGAFSAPFSVESPGGEQPFSSHVRDRGTKVRKREMRRTTVLVLVTALAMPASGSLAIAAGAGGASGGTGAGASGSGSTAGVAGSAKTGSQKTGTAGKGGCTTGGGGATSAGGSMGASSGGGATSAGGNMSASSGGGATSAGGSMSGGC
jgi:hypothetical protein